MHDEFTPLLTTTDWNEEWKELQKVRRHADDAAFWDKRSATFTTKDAPNLYVEKFLGYADIRPGETVFDMGCGTGLWPCRSARRAQGGGGRFLPGHAGSDAGAP